MTKKVLACLLAVMLALSLLPGTAGAEEKHPSVTVQTLIEPQYEAAASFNEGLAAVKQNGKWGYIDETGAMVIQPKYDWAGYFREGVAVVGKAGTAIEVVDQVYNKDKEEWQDIEDTVDVCYLYLVYPDGTEKQLKMPDYGSVDSSTFKVTSYINAYVYPDYATEYFIHWACYDGVVFAGEQSYLPNGTLIWPAYETDQAINAFRTTGPCVNGIIPVAGYCFYNPFPLQVFLMDESGNVVQTFLSFTELEPDEGLTTVFAPDADRITFWLRRAPDPFTREDRAGAFALGTKYDYEDVEEAVKQYMDANRWVDPEVLDEIRTAESPDPADYDTWEEYSAALDEYEQSFINKYGKSYEDYSLEYRHVYSDKYAEITNKLLYEDAAVPAKYTDFRYTFDGTFFCDGVWVVKNEAGKWGAVDKDGKTVIPFEYDYLDSFSEGMAGAIKNGKGFYIDLKNNVYQIEGPDGITPTITALGPFADGIAPVYDSNSGKAYCVQNAPAGNNVLPLIVGSDKLSLYSYFPDYEGKDNVGNVANISDSIIVIKEGGKWGYAKLSFELVPTPYTITFDPNGGKVSPTTAKTGEDGKLASLPTPTRDGYSFADWYTAKTGGEKVTSAYTFTDDATVYAHWTENSGGGNGSGSGSSSGGGGATRYAVSTPSKTDNGSVTVSPKNAAQGKTVTITPKPDEGCKVDKVTVTDKNGSPVEVKDNGDGTYSFTMPGSKVNVTAAFVKNEPAPADNERFTDVPKDAWYHDAVYWAADNGITQGVDDTHFVPNGTCTRSEAVTFLWRAKGEPEPTTTTNPFKDVKESDYFYKAVLWAVENGITVGVKADAFAPKQTCSTAHILTFLYRTMGVGADGWYEDAGAWAEKDGLLKDTGLTANPKVNCPRGAVVTFLYREQK